MDVEYADLELNEDVCIVSEHFIDSVFKSKGDCTFHLGDIIQQIMMLVFRYVICVKAH